MIQKKFLNLLKNDLKKYFSIKNNKYLFFTEKTLDRIESAKELIQIKQRVKIIEIIIFFII